jgi:hypothetical protein
MTSGSANAAGPERASRVKTIIRALLFCGGIGLVAWLVHRAGTERVLHAIADAGPWLPLIVLLEVGIVATDALALRSLLRERAEGMTRATWIHSVSLAYGCAVVLPAGRAAGEAARAAALARVIGLASAGRACARLQGSSLAANAIASVAAAAVVALVGVAPKLPLALLGNAVLCGALGVGILALAQSARFARALRSWLPVLFRSAVQTPELPETRSTSAGAILASALGRAIQAVQYGVVVRAVGGIATVGTAVAAQGIHLVGATIGDPVPGQVGATEGAYEIFASAVGLGDAPARAIAIALVVRVAQLLLAAGAFGVAFAVDPHRRESEVT